MSYAGLGLVPGDEGCPPNTSRFGIPGGQCLTLTPGTSQTCPPGSTPTPDLLGFLVCTPGGAAPPLPVNTCPDGQMGFPSLGIPCTPIPGQPQVAPPSSAPQCPDGQLGWPSLGLPCMAVPGAPQPSITPPQAQNTCGAGQIGWPPYVPCMALPAAPAAPPGVTPCPPGTVGLFPNCFAIPGTPPPVAPRPPNVPVGPNGQPPASAPLPSWVLPVAIGAGLLGLFFIFKPKAAKA